MSKLEPGEAAELTAKGGKLLLGEAQAAREPCSECGWNGGGQRDEGCMLGPCPKADIAKTFPAFAEGFQQGHAHALDAAARAAQLYDGRAANAIRALAAPVSPSSEGCESADKKRLDFIEEWARRSRTGVSVDWSEEGYRFMSFHQLGDFRPSAREAIDEAIDEAIARLSPSASAVR